MAKRKSTLDKTIRNELVQNTIDEAVIKWTHEHFQTPHRAVKSVLVEYAREVGRRALRHGEIVPTDEFYWKRDLANRQYDNLKKDERLNTLVSETIEKIEKEFPKVVGDIDDKLRQYGLVRIAQVTSMVSQMILSKLDPDLL